MGGKSEWTFHEVVDIFERKGWHCRPRDIHDAIEVGLVDIPGGGIYAPRRARVGKKWIKQFARCAMRRSKIKKHHLGERIRRLMKIMPLERAAERLKVPAIYAANIMLYETRKKG